MANNSKMKPTQAHQPQRPFLISSAVLMDVMRYLMTRPYGEVVKLMGGLSTLNQLYKIIWAYFVKQQAVETNAKK